MPVQRGRKQTSLNVVTLPGQRPAPPDYLTEDQKNIWKQVAATKAADWFTADSHPLLAQFCRHVATAHLLAQQIDMLTDLSDKNTLARLSSLLKMRAVESNSILHLAASMRMTHLSRYKAETAATSHANINSGSVDKPWQSDGK